MSTAARPAESAGELGVAVLHAVRGQHAFEACVEQLGTAIRLGVFPHGSTLPPERELATRMNVSRATLREAMAALREADLVETRRGRHGGTVVTLTPKLPARSSARRTADRRADWLDTLDFRRIVEPGAAALAASRELTAPQRRTLEKAHAVVAGATKPATHRQADSRFHLTIATLTGSARAVEAVTSVQAGLHEMLGAIPVLGTNIDHSDRQHARIVRAVLAGDPATARRAMEQHCDDTAALLRGLLE
ncbi:FadR family transcriptional regulator [Nocardioides mangrovicus]|uniref:FadR family transcriptional regulator n=1 Tax=Nocardioides mangrovicus TaxID=2478913 RepID=A0A3L8P3B1_9ACTN|nr:FCD domain-containing protein [Nocardioides mangrovicus]RLV49477.1 FadR family transcriptional regulator [Nocardioides mangrovicus]